MKRTILLVTGATALLLSQTAGHIGLFEAESDVGNPAIKGSVAFDPAKKEYRIAGSGANIWARTDEFHFVWLQLSGNVRMTATLHFEGTSPSEHRKAGLMLRKSLETGAPYVDAVVHGNGLTALQVRETADDITRGFNFPVVASTRIQLERRGDVYSLWQGKGGEPLQEAGSIQCNLGDPVYAGLFISAHNPKLSETAVFSDVTLETLPGAAAGKKSGNKK
jgi:TolB protein